MGTVNGWRAVGGGGGILIDGTIKRTWGKTSIQTFSKLFLKIVSAGAVTMEARIVFQYFTKFTEKADLLL